MNRLFFAAAVLVFAGLVAPLTADQIAINPTKDNTLYEDAQGSKSNGVGDYLFAGRTGFGGGSDKLHRAVLAFDVAGNVPAGSTINSVTLRLVMSKTISGANTVTLHKLLADWGEGTSDAPLEEGGGASSTTGDATWIHTFFSTSNWTSAGGDFSAGASASTSVNAVGTYTWGSTAAMVGDVQGWLDNSASDWGWILIGNESTQGSSKRFNSGEFGTVDDRPLLTIDYTAPIPEPGTLLLIGSGLALLIARVRGKRTR